MKKLGYVTFLCFLFCASTESSYEGYQVWRAVPASEDVLLSLRELENVFKLDFWKEPVALNRPVDFLVSPEQENGVKNFFKARGISDYNIFIQDVQSLIEQQKLPSLQAKSQRKSTARNLASFDYSVYHTPDEVYDWMDMVVDEHPGLVSKQQFGVTYQGRPLYVLKFEKVSMNPKPVIFVDALIHCREWITTASLLFIFKEMLRNPAYAHMMDEADWYFVPMINVDGYVETWTGDRLWRKTRSTGASSTCVGVDGNRNWGAFWSLPGASGDPCSLVYYGPTQESESEIRNLANYILGLGEGHIDAYVSTHSYSQLILYAYGYSDVPSKDDAVLNITGKLMSDAIREVHGKEYVYGPASTTIYVSSGITSDWTYEVAKIPLSYTYELRDTGTHGFLLPPDQIIPNGEEYLAGLAALKKYVVDSFNEISGDGI